MKTEKAVKMKKKCVKCSEEGSKHYVCDRCCVSVGWLVDNVLSYINTYINRSSLIQLKLAVLGFFNDKDISDAKQLLYDMIDGLDLIHANVLRHNSTSRSSREAELDDIISIFSKVASDKSVTMPKIVVEDITRLPLY